MRYPRAGKGERLRDLGASRGDFERMNRVVERHRLRPVIDRVLPFAECPDAFTHLERRAYLGKIVINRA